MEKEATPINSIYAVFAIAATLIFDIVQVGLVATGVGILVIVILDIVYAFLLGTWLYLGNHLQSGSLKWLAIILLMELIPAVQAFPFWTPYLCVIVWMSRKGGLKLNAVSAIPLHKSNMSMAKRYVARRGLNKAYTSIVDKKDIGGAVEGLTEAFGGTEAYAAANSLIKRNSAKIRLARDVYNGVKDYNQLQSTTDNSASSNVLRVVKKNIKPQNLLDLKKELNS